MNSNIQLGLSYDSSDMSTALSSQWTFVFHVATLNFLVISSALWKNISKTLLEETSVEQTTLVNTAIDSNNKLYVKRHESDAGDALH